MPAAEQRALRGNRIAMIFQEPMTALNPVSPVGRQIAEMFVLHQGKNWREANRLAVEALASVRVPAPERRVKDYPHQLSGGMRQRVMIAIALACGPDLLIADEPTTALDVTVQAEIIELMRNLCAERGTAILMISHDLGLVANVCRRVAVMYAGRIVEERGSDDIFRAMLASLYARPGRLAAAAGKSRCPWPDAAHGDRGRRAGDHGFPGRLPIQSALRAGDRHLPDHRAGDDMARCRRASQVPSPCMNARAKPGDDVILSVEDLAVHFPVGGGLLGGGRRLLRAVDGVDLELKRGECLGLVGESGCGKSTLALSILGLQAPTRGRIVLDGQVVTGRPSGDRKALARIVQIVFQDPYASLNPRQTVRRTLEDPLRLHGVTAKSEIDGRVAAMLRHVGLRPEQAGRYPHEFSGGQRQRIGIARALILNPKIVICDEPVSALDVSIRAQIINLLLELKETLGLSYIMISHDLGVVEHMSDRVAVMYLGRIVETGDWREIFERPAHPYTQTLIAAIPDPLRRAPLATTQGELPNPLNPPDGCAFSPRCRYAEAVCHRAPCHRLKRVPTDTRSGAGELTRLPVRRRWPRPKAGIPRTEDTSAISQMRRFWHARTYQLIG